MGPLVAELLQVALVVIMFSLGLGLRFADFLQVVAKPRAFLLGLAAQMILLPVVAYGIVFISGLSPELAVGFLILAFSPGGPTSNLLSRYARGDVALSISLTGTTNLLAVLTLPLLVPIAARHFMGLEAPEINVTWLGIRMFALTTMPVLAGMILLHFFEPQVKAARPIVSRIAMLLFLVIMTGAIVGNWDLVTENLPKLGPTIASLNLVMLVIGLLLPQTLGLGRREATSISLEVGMQNALLGITVGTLLHGEAGAFSAYSLPAAVYGVTMFLINVPFAVWRRMGADRAAPA